MGQGEHVSCGHHQEAASGGTGTPLPSPFPLLYLSCTYTCTMYIGNMVVSGAHEPREYQERMSPASRGSCAPGSVCTCNSVCVHVHVYEYVCDQIRWTRASLANARQLF